ncbi:TetR/AcrR family transcriptional regulator [Halioxenophilus aromaticivorans]
MSLKPVAAPDLSVQSSQSQETETQASEAQGSEAKARRNLKAEDRRAAIIQAAGELFTQHGFEKTSLDMIIAQSGGSKRAIYDLFGDKLALLHAVAVAMIDQVMNPIFDTDLNLKNEKQFLTHLGSSFLLAMISPQGIAIFKELIAQANNTDGLGTKIWQIGPERLQQQLANYLDHLVQKKHYSIANTHVASCQFFSLIKGDLHLKYLIGAAQASDRDNVEQHINNTVDAFLKLIR